MVEGDGIHRHEAREVVLVGRVVAVPGDDVERRMAELGGPQVAEELGMSASKLYDWRRKYAPRPGADTGAPRNLEEAAAEIARLRADLVRMQERENVLKKSLGILSEMPPRGMPKSKP